MKRTRRQQLRAHEASPLFDMPLDMWFHILTLVPCVYTICRMARVCLFFQPCKDHHLLHGVLQERLRQRYQTSVFVPEHISLFHMSHAERAYKGILLHAVHCELFESCHNSVKFIQGDKTSMNLGRESFTNISNKYISRVHCSFSLPTIQELLVGYLCMVRVKGVNGVKLIRHTHPPVLVKPGYKFLAMVGDTIELAQNTRVYYKFDYV